MRTRRSTTAGGVQAMRQEATPVAVTAVGVVMAVGEVAIDFCPRAD